MKIPLIITYILCSLALSAQVQKNISLSTSTVKSAISGGDGAQYVLVSNTGISAYAPNGEPLLPVCFYRFTVPANKDLSSLTVTYTGAVQTTLTTKVYPGQQVSPDPAVPFVFTPPLASIYSSSAVYPAQRAFISNISWYGINKIVTVGVYMCSYIPSQNKLTCYTGAQFSASFTAAASIPAMVKRPAIRWDEEIATVKQKVANPEKAAEYYTYNNNLATAPSSLKSGETSPEYVIICPDALCSAFDEFLFWKRRKGVNAEIVKLSTVLASNRGDEISGIYDGPGKVRQYLINAHYKGLKYALIVGDMSVAEATIRYTTVYPPSAIARANRKNNNTSNYQDDGSTDYYFADLTGNWDKDRDGFYGETGEDAVHFDPEMYVGRLLCSNVQQIQNWITKSLIYEQNPGLGNASYLNKSIFISADGFSPAEVVNALPSSMLANIIYETPSDVDPSGPTGNSLITEMSTGYGLWGSFVHGSPSVVNVAAIGTGQGTAGIYCITSEDRIGTARIDPRNGLDNLTNYSKPGVYFGISCSVTPYQNTKAFNNGGYMNMGEAFTTCKGGGVAFLGGTNVLNYESGIIYMKFLQGLSTANSERCHFGIGLSVAKDTLKKTTLQAFKNINGKDSIGIGWSLDRQHYFAFYHTLIGCPEMSMWVKTPLKFTNALVSRNGTDATVNTGTVGGATICVTSSDGRTYWEVKTLGATNYTVTFANVPADALVTVTKDGYLPFLSDYEYIQNETFTGYAMNSHPSPKIGYDVTTTKAYGNVIIKNGACLVLTPTGSVSIKNGFVIEKGGTFEIQLKQ